MELVCTFIKTDKDKETGSLHDINMIHTKKKLNVIKLSMFCFTLEREGINEMERTVKKIIN